MKYPLSLRFKVIALASQIKAVDSSGDTVFYVKQKLFKFKENIEIYSDDTKTKLLYTLKADRVIDYSPELSLIDTDGNKKGSIKRLGRKSIWRSTYVLNDNHETYRVTELNPWTKVIDTLFSEIPFIGLLGGFFFHPKYNVVNESNNETVAILSKESNLFEGKYVFDASAANHTDSRSQIFSILMMAVVLRERTRG